MLIKIEIFHEPLTTIENKCNIYLATATVFGLLLLVATFLTISLAMRLRREQSIKSINELIMEKQFSRNNTMNHLNRNAFYNYNHRTAITQ